jgi:hypothetical protein
MFSVDKGTQAKTSFGDKLAGNAIHDVEMTSVEMATIGKDTTYDVVNINFTNKDGEYQETIFCPDLKTAMQRQPNNFGGENPSAMEQLTARIRHMIAALNPDLDKKIEAGEKSLSAKDWNAFRKLIVDSLKPGLNKPVQLKLVIDNKGRAVTPGFLLSISKAGNLYFTTNFIGEKVTFTDKELEKITKSMNSKPTNMGGLPKATEGEEDELGDLDLSNL